MSTLKLGPHSVTLTHPDKVLFPEDGLTKGELIDYYRRIADTMLPYLRGRPLMTHHFPGGIDKPGFHQQNLPDHYPDWIKRVTVDKEGGKVSHVLCGDASTLVYLANQNCITPHIWQSRADRPHFPDRLIFDLDPPGDDFTPLRKAARALRELLGELGLPAYLMTTGSSGLHLITPLDRSADFVTVRSFAQQLAEVLVERQPREFTTEQRKNKRGQRVFLDTLRNAYGQLSVPPYAVRAKPGAPVATPLDWEELSNPAVHARRYTIRNLFRRLGQKGDPWARQEHGYALEAARGKLQDLRKL